MEENLHLFEGYGVELEYMIVDKNNLSVAPIADKLIHSVTGEYSDEIEFGDIAWTNEIVLHVIELKTSNPSKDICSLPALFQEQINKINNILEGFNAKLLPGGSHPLMNPFTETKLWPHSNNTIYDTYNKIFDCKGHGWSNMQSIHLNLPFFNDEEFAKLHAAVRLVLPIIPAISASTPILDGKPTGIADTRLDVYKRNQLKIPSITGQVIPERCFSKHDYEEFILKKIYGDIAPYDKDNILQHEWLNSRGAIARFDRNTIEIRIIDIQESTVASLAVVAAIVTSIKSIVAEKWLPLNKQMQWSEEVLLPILLNTIKNGGLAVIDNPEYLQVFGYTGNSSCTASQLWKHILESNPEYNQNNNELSEAMNLIFEEGTLSKRIINSLNGNYSEENIIRIYNKLADCLSSGRMFSHPVISNQLSETNVLS